MDDEVSTHTFLTMIIEESVCFIIHVHDVWTIVFGGAIILMRYTRNIFLLAYDNFFINRTVRMSDNLPERVQILGHAHIICITVRENRIICCQIFCDLLLKSAFERIFNVMQLILVKIKWRIKWKYLIQKFHDICLSYYFKGHHYHLSEYNLFLPWYSWQIFHLALDNNYSLPIIISLRKKKKKNKTTWKKIHLQTQIKKSRVNGYQYYHTGIMMNMHFYS